MQESTRDAILRKSRILQGSTWQEIQGKIGIMHGSIGKESSGKNREVQGNTGKIGQQDEGRTENVLTIMPKDPGMSYDMEQVVKALTDMGLDRKMVRGINKCPYDPSMVEVSLMDGVPTDMVILDFL